MKIVHVVEPLAGGMVTFLKSLVENMPDDFHIIVHGERKEEIAFTEVRKQFVYPNVRFLRWRSAQRNLRLMKDFSAFMELYTILKRLKNKNLVDVVHLHSSKGGFLGRVVCRLLGIKDKVVYTPNGAPFMVGKNAVSNFLYKMLEKLAATFGGQVVCCSPSEKEAYQKVGIEAITINNGTQSAKAHYSLPDTPKKDGTFRIVTTGRIVNQKNPVLFNKIASYFEEFKNFEFVWVGDGSERELLSSKNIQVTGWIPREEVHSIVTRADVYLSTASYEGLPFAVLEALALKKPVLLSDCTGNKDLVIKGLNGDIFNNETDAIHKILQFYNNSSMLSVMGEHSGSHCSTHFDLLNTFQNYKKLYKQTSYTALLQEEKLVGLNH